MSMLHAADEMAEPKPQNLSSGVEDVIVRACVRNRCWILVEGGPTGGLRCFAAGFVVSVVLIQKSPTGPTWPSRNPQELLATSSFRCQWNPSSPRFQIGVRGIEGVLKYLKSPERWVAVAQASCRELRGETDHSRAGRSSSLRFNFRELCAR